MKKVLSLTASAAVTLTMLLTSLSFGPVTAAGEKDRPSDAAVYMDFTGMADAVLTSGGSFRSAGNDITVQNADGASSSYEIKDGALVMRLVGAGTDPFLRLNNHGLELCEGADAASRASKYRYMVMRVKGTTTDEGMSINGGPGMGAIGVAFGNAASGDHGVVLRSTAVGAHKPALDPDGNTMPEITGTYQDLVIALKDEYFAGAADGWLGGMWIRSMSSTRNITLTIESIYFTNTNPNEPVKPDYPDDAAVYMDFTGMADAVLTSGGSFRSAGNDITVQNADGASSSYEIKGGALVMKLVGAGTDPFLRLNNHGLELCEGADAASRASKYRYMVMRVKGTTTDEGMSINGGPGMGAIGVAFGNAASGDHGVVLRSTAVGAHKPALDPDGNTMPEITGTYQDLVIALKDEYFAGAADGWLGGMWIRSMSGTRNITLTIESIYFTNTNPNAGSDEPSYNDNNTLPADGIFIEDGRRDSFGFPYNGDNPLTYDNGGVVSKITEITGIPDTAFTMAGGIITYAITANEGMSLAMLENYYSQYEYTVFRIRAISGDGTSFAVKLGSNGAGQVTFNSLKFSEKNYVKPLSADWQDIYVRNDAALNGLNGQPYLKLLGLSAAEIEIDCIYMTDTVPEGYVPGGDTGYVPPVAGDDVPDPERPDDAEIYADFNTPIQQDAETASGNGEGSWVKLFHLESGAQTVENNVLKLKLTGPAAYIRFTNSLELTGGTTADTFKYMAINLKGSAAWGDGAPVEGSLLKVIFGSFGNEGNPALISASQVNGETFTTVYIELKDEYFANTHADFKSGLILYNAGGFNSTLEINDIFFTNTAPADEPGPDPEDPGDGVIPSGAIYVEDGKRDEFVFPYGDSKLNFVNGLKSSFLNAVEIGANNPANAFVIKNGVVVFNSTQNADASYSLGENYYSSAFGYKYLVFRIRSTDGSSGSKFGVKLGSNAAEEIRFDKLRTSLTNYVPAVTGEWQDIYILLDEVNGVNNMPYLKLFGHENGAYEIDHIFFAKELPEDYKAGPAVSGTDVPVTGDTLPAVGIALLTAGGLGLLFSRKRKTALK